MTDTALQALERGLKTALSGAPEAPGGVYYDRAQAGAQRPYFVFNRTGGGESNDRRVEDAEFTVQVKCVADTRGAAHAGAAAIAARLNDQGSQDGGTLSGAPDWIITTCTQEGTVDLPEYFADADPIYHVGAVYRVVMERL